MYARDITDPTLGSVLRAVMAPGEFDALFAAARMCHFAAGQMIFAAGEPGETLILIEDGRVEVSITAASGRKSVLAHAGTGELLGEIAALDGGARSADAVAVSAVGGRVLLRANLLAFIAERPALAEAMIKELCQKVRNASEMFTTVSTIDAAPRLAQALLRLFDKWGRPDPQGELLSERFSQAELGEFSGLARENVNRQLRAWSDEGILATVNRHLLLKDRDALELIAGD